MPGPELTVRGAAGDGGVRGGDGLRGVVVMFHGGQQTSRDEVRVTNTSWLRMRVLQHRLAGPAADAGVAVALLRYRERGWNAESGPEPAAVRDGRWALDQVAARYGEAPVVLVGHSMGGRTACRLADATGVRGIVALAPWLPAGEPVGPARGQRFVLAHGTMDRWTSPPGSLDWSLRARAAGATVGRFELPMVGHFYVRPRERVEPARAAGCVGVTGGRAAAPRDHDRIRRGGG